MIFEKKNVRIFFFGGMGGASQGGVGSRSGGRGVVNYILINRFGGQFWVKLPRVFQI